MLPIVLRIVAANSDVSGFKAAINPRGRSVSMIRVLLAGGVVRVTTARSLDLFWIRDKSLTDTDSLPAPEIIAAEIADDLEATLEQFNKIVTRLA